MLEINFRELSTHTKFKFSKRKKKYSQNKLLIQLLFFGVMECSLKFIIKHVTELNLLKSHIINLFTGDEYNVKFIVSRERNYFTRQSQGK